MTRDEIISRLSDMESRLEDLKRSFRALFAGIDEVVAAAEFSEPKRGLPC